MPPSQVSRRPAGAVPSARDFALLDAKAEQVFDKLVRAAASLTLCPIALVCFLDTDRHWFAARFGFGRPGPRRDHAVCALAALGTTRPVVIPDTTRDPRLADNPLVLGPPPIRFFAGVPVASPEGQALGTLCVLDRVPRALDPAQLGGLEQLAGVVSAMLEIRRAARLRVPAAA